MRISDWSSDVCSSDLARARSAGHRGLLQLDRLQRCDPGPRGGDLRRRGPAQQGRPARQAPGLRGVEGRRRQLRPVAVAGRSEERRVGKGGVSTVRFAGAPVTEKKKKDDTIKET